MSIILRDGTNAGHLAAIDASGNLSVAINGSIAAGSNLIGQVEVSDGTNVLFTVAHPGVVSTAPASDRTQTGTINSSPTANVAISTQGGGTVLFNITGTWSGTISFEASVDGTNWSPAVALPKYPSGAASANSTTSNGNWAVNVGGLNMFRVRGSAWTSGTATIWLEVGQATNVQEVFQYFASNLLTDINASGTALTATGSALDVNIASGSVAVSGTVTANQGTSPWVISFTSPQAVTQSGTWSTRTLGNNGLALDGAAGAATPPQTVQVGGSDGANLRAISTDSNGQVKVLVQNTPSVTVTGTVAVTQSTSPWTIQGDSASGAANAGNPVKTGGVFNTTQPTVTNGQTVDSQSTARGGTIVATGVDTFNVTVNTALPAGSNVIGHVITDSGSTTVITGTVAVTQSTSPWVVSLASTTITGTVAVTQSTTPWTVAGAAASGAAKSGNPVQMGGVFNTTQPTVTTGQAVELQATARGAQIVATGVDNFVVSSITNNVGVTQATSPWVENLTQVAGTALGATAVTNFGTAPAAAAVPGVNANIYSAGAAITASAPLGVQLSQGNAVISNTNPIFSSITDGTTKVTVIAGTAALKTDLSSVAGTATVTAAAGVQKVGIVGGTGTSLETTAGVLDYNLKNINNAAVSTAASGVQKVGIVGNAGATVDGTVAAGTAPTNAIAVLGQFNTTIPAPTAAQTVSLQTDSTGALAISTEGRKTTYRVGIVAFTPIASATAPTVSITGSATKTVRITRIVFSASAATGTISDLQLLRFSALTGGTANSQAANVTKMDTNNAAQTAVVNQWSAAATTATSAGILNAKRFEVVTAAVSVQPGEIEWKFGDDNGQGLVLRGTGDFAGIRISAVGTTPVADCWVEWTEE